MVIHLQNTSSTFFTVMGAGCLVSLTWMTPLKVLFQFGILDLDWRSPAKRDITRTYTYGTNKVVYG